MINLAIAVHDVHMQLLYNDMYMMSCLVALNFEQNIDHC